jgi:prolipoprotein diacylglyceryltransferase
MTNYYTSLSFLTFDNGHAIVNLMETSTWYATAYQIAFFLGLSLFVYEGIRRKYPLSTWLLISAAASFLLVVGSKLGTFSLSDWRLFFQEGVLESTGKKTAIGAILLIIACLWLVTKALRFKAPVWGAFAFFLPVVMLVQRVGCLLAGCCYGKSMESIGGVKYFGPSMIRDQQIHQHLITPAQDITQAVHNVPLYFMGVAFFTIALLLFVQKRIGNGKALMFVSLLSMGAGRLLVEFFRDPLAHSLPQPVFYGLTQQQWFIAIFLILFSALLYFEFKKAPKPHIAPAIFPLRNLVFMLGLSIVTLVLRDWFTNYEKVVVYSQLIIAGVLNIKTIWEVEHRLKPILAPLSLFLMSSWIIAQEVPSDNTQPLPSKTYFNGSFTQNRLSNPSYPCLQIASGCAGDYCALADSASIHGPIYQSAQLGFEHQLSSSRHHYRSFGMGMDVAVEQYSNRLEERTFRYFHISPYGKIYSEFASLSLGIRIGQLYTPDHLENRGVLLFLPRYGLEVGTEKTLFNLKVGVLDDYLPNGIMPSIFSSRINARIINSNKLIFRGGLAYGFGDFGNGNFMNNQGYYLGINFVLHNLERDFIVMPTLGYTNSRRNEGAVTNYPQFAIQFRSPIF